MEVSLQYAEQHLADLISAADRGEDVEITRPEKPALKLSIAPASTTASRKSLLGAGKGEIWLSDDWDSPETNEDIAKLFENSALFPEPPTH